VECVFCDRVAAGEFVAENELVVAFFDAFPVSPDHCLIVPRRHEPDFLALTAEENVAAWALLASVRARIEADRRPDGYNIGINVGRTNGSSGLSNGN
jgi:diadenosine tetraphosphate (Ap4A) HIT family hydrolase